MGFDFLTDLSNMQVEIPPEVSRLAGFFVLLQGGMIYLQKKNNPAKDIWEDLSWVFLGGLFVYLFPELIRFMETLVYTLAFTVTLFFSMYMLADLFGVLPPGFIEQLF